MCVINNQACGNYRPDFDRAREQGHLCFGMGYEPDCECGVEAMYHRYLGLDEQLESENVSDR